LFDVNLRVGAGEIVIMTGPSGGGKTTLLTIIGALRSAQEGSVQVLGKELLGAGEREMVAVRRYIGYIFQAHNLLKSITARQNVLMSLDLHEQFSPTERSEKAAEMLKPSDSKNISTKSRQTFRRTKTARRHRQSFGGTSEIDFSGRADRRFR
jgi:putative ABC transport system ATP-binding protein